MKIVWGRSIGWNMELNKMRKAPPGYKWVKVTDLEYTIIENGVDCYPWTECYAWLPVKTITGNLAWRQKIYKRKVWKVWGTGFHMEPEIQYATVFDLLKISPK